MKTIFDIIDAILVKFFGEYYDRTILLQNPALRISFEKFAQILCDPATPMYSSRRTIRGKWLLLHDLQYLTKVNQRASRLNIEKIIEDFLKE